MPHWAEIDDDNVVLRVVVCDADDGQDGELHPPAFLTDTLGGEWVRTYYDTPGKCYAGVGYAWRADLGNGGAFVPPRPYASWTLDDDGVWQPPIPKPTAPGIWNWNDTLGVWEVWVPEGDAPI